MAYTPVHSFDRAPAGTARVKWRNPLFSLIVFVVVGVLAGVGVAFVVDTIVKASQPSAEAVALTEDVHAVVDALTEQVGDGGVPVAAVCWPTMGEVGACDVAVLRDGVVGSVSVPVRVADSSVVVVSSDAFNKPDGFEGADVENWWVCGYVSTQQSDDLIADVVLFENRTGEYKPVKGVSTFGCHSGVF